MTSAGSIRAGRAFIEMTISDETIQASLDNVKAKLRTFAAAVDATATGSFATMNASAVSGTAATSASVGVLSATMGVLSATVYAVGVAFNAVFARATTSVLKAVGVIGTLAFAIGTYLPGGKLAGFLNNFMSKSQTTEAIGRWTRFAGVLTGSSAFRDIGKRIERLGLGASIVQGFKTGGLFGGIGASIGAGIRSARSVIAGALTSVVASPFRAVGGLFRSSVGAIGGGASGSLGSTAASAGTLAAGLSKTATSGRAAVNVLGLFRGIAGTLAGVAIKVGGLAAAISGPAIVAGKAFVGTAAEMIKAAKETGESLASLIHKKFGGGGLVSKRDIQSAAELSDAFTELKQSTAAAWAQISIAALPVVKAITQSMIKWMDVIGQFLHQNRDLVSTVIQTAAKIAAISAAVVSLYGAFIAALPVITALMSPLGLLVVAMTAIAVLFPRIRAEASSVFQFLFGQFTELGTIANDTFTGIANAMSGGSLQAAANVLWAGLKLAWLTGSQSLRAVWREMVTSMSASLIDMFYGALKAWQVVAGGIVSIWTTIQNSLARGLARMIAAASGQNVDDVLAELKKDQDREATDRDGAMKKKMEELEAERKATIEANDDINGEKHKAAQKELDDARAAFKQAQDEAAALARKKAGAPGGVSGLKGTETLSTFSVAGVGRTNIGGVASLKQPLNNIDDNTKKLADNAGKNPFQWVA